MGALQAVAGTSLIGSSPNQKKLGKTARHAGRDRQGPGHAELPADPVHEDETRGSLTDRGLLFLLLGPPTYAGRKPIGAGDDTSDSQGLSSVGRHDAELAIGSAQATGGRMTTGKANSIADRSSGAGTTMTEASANWREVWHYRRELLPRGVPYQQVDFEFITRKGYGKNVLQRDSPAPTTLDAARQKMRPAPGRAS